MVQIDRNRRGRVVACYIRDNIRFNVKACLSNNIETIFINAMFPKTELIRLAVINKPPN